MVSGKHFLRAKTFPWSTRSSRSSPLSVIRLGTVSSTYDHTEPAHSELSVHETKRTQNNDTVQWEVDSKEIFGKTCFTPG